jgi:hypothetical protein
LGPFEKNTFFPPDPLSEFPTKGPLGSRTSTGAGGRRALAMVDDREGWEMCEEREGEEGRGAGQMLVLDHAEKLQGGFLAHFWGKKCFFAPEMH